jgi:hypothetical protein
MGTMVGFRARDSKTRWRACDRPSGRVDFHRRKSLPKRSIHSRTRWANAREYFQPRRSRSAHRSSSIAVAAPRAGASGRGRSASAAVSSPCRACPARWATVHRSDADLLHVRVLVDESQIVQVAPLHYLALTTLRSALARSQRPFLRASYRRLRARNAKESDGGCPPYVRFDVQDDGAGIPLTSWDASSIRSSPRSRSDRARPRFAAARCDENCGRIEFQVGRGGPYDVCPRPARVE